jgi:hypothetical protein
VLIGLAVLLGLALLFAGGAAGQRSAWMEGYMMGRLSAVSTGAEAGAGAAAAAAMLPYAPYGMGFAHRGPGLGGVLFFVLGLGAVAFIASRCFHRARWRAWMAAQGAQGGAQTDWRQGPPPPWVHGPWGTGPWGQGPWAGGPMSGSAPANQPEQGQPPAPPSQPGQPPVEPPAADR